MARFTTENKDIWKFTYMIMQPENVTEELFHRTVAQVGRKKNPPALAKVRFKSLTEGAAAQIMHLGPFADEGPTIERLHEFIEKQGYHRRGKHHEIYLSDIRRVSPEKMKTIIRQPVK